MRAEAAVLLAGSLALLTGCAPPMVACSAVGYMSVARITLADPRPGITLELCDGEGCTPGPPMQPVEIDETEKPSATGVTEVTGSSAEGWSASLIGGQPVLGYRVTDAAGAVLAEGHVDVEWVRVDGTEICGGNREADVTIRPEPPS